MLQFNLIITMVKVIAPLQGFIMSGPRTWLLSAQFFLDTRREQIALAGLWDAPGFLYVELALLPPKK
jgi:hypothetical protein